jgi:hypothetical protein
MKARHSSGRWALEVADFYDDMAAMVQELLAPTSEDGLGQGSIALVRYTAGAPGPDPWSPPSTPSRTVTTLDGAATGIAKELIGTPVETGGQIVATDKMVIVAPWGGSYDPADVLELDNSPVTILRIDNIPAVGTPVAIRFVVR